MYPHPASRFTADGAHSEPKLAQILARLEAGPPPCACPPQRDHRCRGCADADCDCCHGGCACPFPRQHVCLGDCHRLDRWGRFDAKWDCPCCHGRCACPLLPGLCAHSRAWLASVEEVWPVLLLLEPRPAHRKVRAGPRKGAPEEPARDPWFFDAYLDPPPPTDEILTPDVAARVQLMRERVERGEGVFARKQLNLPAFEHLARQAVDRGPNGNDVTTGPTLTERAVRHGA